MAASASTQTPPVQAASDREAAWRTLVDRLASDLDEIAEETTARIVDGLPGYRGLSRERVFEGVRRTLGAGHRGLVEQRHPVEGEQLPNARRCGEAAAARGIPVDDLLHAYRVGLDVMRRRVMEDAPSGPHRDGVVLQALDIVIAWNSSGMEAAAAAHRDTELELMREEEHQLATLVRGILLGTVGPPDRRALLELYGIDFERTYHAVCARPTGGVGTKEIRRYLGLEDENRRVCGAVTLMEGDVCGFVTDLPQDPSPVPIGASPRMPFDRLGEAFPLSIRALETARVARGDGVHQFGDLGLAPAILSEQEVGTALSERYVAPLERLGRAGHVILDTVESFLAHDRQLGATARELGVHANTVRYRVGRFEQVTRSSLRSTEQFVEIWWALRRRGLTRAPVLAEGTKKQGPGLAPEPE